MKIILMTMLLVYSSLSFGDTRILEASEEAKVIAVENEEQTKNQLIIEDFLNTSADLFKAADISVEKEIVDPRINEVLRSGGDREGNGGGLVKTEDGEIYPADFYFEVKNQEFPTVYEDFSFDDYPEVKKELMEMIRFLKMRRIEKELIDVSINEFKIIFCPELTRNVSYNVIPGVSFESVAYTYVYSLFDEYFNSISTRVIELKKESFDRLGSARNQAFLILHEMLHHVRPDIYSTISNRYILLSSLIKNMSIVWDKYKEQQQGIFNDLSRSEKNASKNIQMILEKYDDNLLKEANKKTVNLGGNYYVSRWGGVSTNVLFASCNDISINSFINATSNGCGSSFINSSFRYIGGESTSNQFINILNDATSSNDGLVVWEKGVSNSTYRDITIEKQEVTPEEIMIELDGRRSQLKAEQNISNCKIISNMPSGNNIHFSGDVDIVNADFIFETNKQIIVANSSIRNSFVGTKSYQSDKMSDKTIEKWMEQGKVDHFFYNGLLTYSYGSVGTIIMNSDIDNSSISDSLLMAIRATNSAVRKSSIREMSFSDSALLNVGKKIDGYLTIRNLFIKNAKSMMVNGSRDLNFDSLFGFSCHPLKKLILLTEEMDQVTRCKKVEFGVDVSRDDFIDSL